MKIFSFTLLIVSLFTFRLCSPTDLEPPGPDPDLPSPEGQWDRLGLTDKSVEQLDIFKNLIFAGTDEGMYRKNVVSKDTVWTPIGLQRFEVLDFIVFSPEYLIASVRPPIPKDPVSIYRTLDGGETWEPYQNNFGGRSGQNVCTALDALITAPDTLFGRGDFVVAKSENGGESWRPVLGEWGSFGYQSDLIRIDEQNPNIVWAGGEGGIFNPYLYKSTDYGETWDFKSVPNDGDNAVYDIEIKPGDSETVVVGLEGLLVRSTDGADSFTITAEPAEGTYFLALDRAPGVSESLVYASGSEFGTKAGSLFFYRSEDFGQTWTKVVNNEDEYAPLATLDLEVRTNFLRDGIFFGTDRGVWLYQGF
ncbi:hypothetical protein AB9P05_15160 [Roseivirga sp. BDSF3-8]|uniref:hypothetical protein n=1 Tax=Roseivirga sp. BDSF3-8 TaxID=3241598 RepID=UPI003531E08D